MPNSAEARRKTQKWKQAEKESAEWKRLLCLVKKKAVKAVKNEADKDGKDKAEEKRSQDSTGWFNYFVYSKSQKWEKTHDSFSLILCSCQKIRVSESQMAIEEEPENIMIRAKGKDGDGFFFWEDIHHPCLPNKDKSNYPDASPNCFFIACMFLLFSV